MILDDEKWSTAKPSPLTCVSSQVHASATLTAGDTAPGDDGPLMLD